MHVDMILADHTTKDTYILGITNLDQQLATTLLNITRQNFVAVLCDPNQMNCQTAYSMSAVSILAHKLLLLKKTSNMSSILKTWTKVHSFELA